MESVHEIVECEGVDLATFPAIELGAKLTEGFAQIAIMRDPRPFANETLDPFRDFLHRFTSFLTPAISHETAAPNGTVPGVVFSIEIAREDDCRRRAEVPALARVMCYCEMKTLKRKRGRWMRGSIVGCCCSW